MLFSNYEAVARRTMQDFQPRMLLSEQLELLNAGLGITGEAGEVADIIKKHIFHGKSLDRDHLIEELGDVLWYIAQTCKALGIEMEIPAIRNNWKLANRYPNGFARELSPHYTSTPLGK